MAVREFDKCDYAHLRVRPKTQSPQVNCSNPSRQKAFIVFFIRRGSTTPNNRDTSYLQTSPNFTSSSRIGRKSEQGDEFTLPDFTEYLICEASLLALLLFCGIFCLVMQSSSRLEKIEHDLAAACYFGFWLPHPSFSICFRICTSFINSTKLQCVQS